MSSNLKFPFVPIPEGKATCSVSPLVNCTLTIPEAFVITPHSSPTAAYVCPTFVFLITHHPSGKKLLFDLGVRHDWETGFTADAAAHAKDPWSPTIVGDVGDLLKEGGVDPKSIHALIFSHHHWDHTGLISPFPDAELVAGAPTFAEPGTDLRTQLDESGRATRGIDFDKERTSAVGAFEKGYDYFGDGSVILCATPGHTKGHISALVRTTPSPKPTYLLLGGDTAHHPSLICTCLHHELHINTTFKRANDPPERGPRVMHADPALATETILRTRRMEEEENVMVVVAHDYMLWRAWKEQEGLLFPGKGIGEWKEKGLKTSRQYDPSTYEQA